MTTDRDFQNVTKGLTEIRRSLDELNRLGKEGVRLLTRNAVNINQPALPQAEVLAELPVRIGWASVEIIGAAKIIDASSQLVIELVFTGDAILEFKRLLPFMELELLELNARNK
jgi:hypothetical protein